jgi:hypothetical protein
MKPGHKPALIGQGSLPNLFQVAETIYLKTNRSFTPPQSGEHRTNLWAVCFPLNQLSA